MPGRSIPVSISPLSYTWVMLACSPEQNRHRKSDDRAEANPTMGIPSPAAGLAVHTALCRRLQSQILRDFFERSARNAAFGAFRFAKLEKVFHVFDPLAQRDVFPVWKNDRFFRSILFR